MNPNFLIFKKSFLNRVLSDNWKDISIWFFTIILDCYLLIDPPITNIKLAIIIVTLTIASINLVYQLFQTANREEEYQAIVRDVSKGIDAFLFTLQVIMMHGDKPNEFNPLKISDESEFLSENAMKLFFSANLSPFRRPIISIGTDENELPSQIKKSCEMNVQFLNDILLLHSNNISSKVKNHFLEIKHNLIVVNILYSLELNAEHIKGYIKKYVNHGIDKKTHTLIVFSEENRIDYEKLIKLLFSLKKLSEK